MDLSGFVGGPTFGQWIDGFDGMVHAGEKCSKPMAMVVQLGTVPEDAEQNFEFSRRAIQAQLPIFYSFRSAANSISLMLTHQEHSARRLKASR